MASKRQGRGKFTHHPNYVAYQSFIVDHPAYAGMPGARDDKGRIVWQTSSGSTTSFFKYFGPRTDWWASRADRLALVGSIKEKDRFAIAARTIHPTGARPCLVCGRLRQVGYYYANAVLTQSVNKLLKAATVKKSDPIDDILSTLATHLDKKAADDFIRSKFPERAAAFAEHGVSAEAFKTSGTLRSTWLSPGFMANCPYRLDGFHDYCFTCRPDNDPGRSKANMATYAHDRRAFVWWCEGNWAVADSLYNSATAGECAICNKRIDKVSPDHPGPLSCGFKHTPLFIPTCGPCNSSKQRRMKRADVNALLAYEQLTGESVASRQILPYWDTHKFQVKTNEDAKLLSDALRELQHHYLVLLHDLLDANRARFLRTLLVPEHALLEPTFVGLDGSTFSYESFNVERKDTPNRRSLAARAVRIAFEELRFYQKKSGKQRKLSRQFTEYFEIAGKRVFEVAAQLPVTENDLAWDAALLPRDGDDDAAIQTRIATLPLVANAVEEAADDELLSALLDVIQGTTAYLLPFAVKASKKAVV